VLFHLLYWEKDENNFIIWINKENIFVKFMQNLQKLNAIIFVKNRALWPPLAGWKLLHVKDWLSTPPTRSAFPHTSTSRPEPLFCACFSRLCRHSAHPQSPALAAPHPVIASACGEVRPRKRLTLIFSHNANVNIYFGYRYERRWCALPPVAAGCNESGYCLAVRRSCCQPEVTHHAKKEGTPRCPQAAEAA